MELCRFYFGEIARAGKTPQDASGGCKEQREEIERGTDWSLRSRGGCDGWLCGPYEERAEVKLMG